MRSRQITAVTAALLTMLTLVVGAADPASAGTLIGATFSAGGAGAVVNSGNSTYAWELTTATPATLSRVTASVPPGTGGSQRYLALNGDANNYAATPDSAATSITDDLDIRAKVTLADWTPTSAEIFLSKWDYADDYSYLFNTEWDGRLTFYWRDAGGTFRWTESTSATGFADNATKWIRVTFVSDQSGQAEARFYTSDDGSSWSQLGTTENPYSEPSSIIDSTAPVRIGSADEGAGKMNGRVYYAEIRNGVDGSVVSRFDPNEANPAAPSAWTSSVGETWTVSRSGTNLPADIARDLSVGTVTGLPAGGTAHHRLIDGMATYSFPPTVISAGTTASLVLSGFTNTSTAGSYASTITTWDDSGPPPVAVDAATTATVTFTDSSFTTTVGVSVDPTLTFTVAAHSGACNGVAQSAGAAANALAVSLGRVGPVNGVGAQDVSVSTNGFGFTVSVRSSGALGVFDDVPFSNALPGAFPSSGTEAFGYTTSDASLGTGTADRFTNGGPKWAALGPAGAEVSYGVGPVDADTACVAFQAQTATVTPAGSYSTTVTYSAIPLY